MIFWGTLIILTAGLLWYMVALPGKSYSGLLPPLSEEQSALRDNLRRHVFAVGGRERYLYYHTAADTPDRVDFGRLARVVYGLHEVLLDLAGARGAGQR